MCFVSLAVTIGQTSGISPSRGADSPLCLIAVNDDQDGLFLLELELKRAFPGARILSAQSGSQAIELWKVEELKVDAFITDHRMPDMTGLDLVRKIRERDQVVPIVMVTLSPETREEALRAGVTLFTSDNRLSGAVAQLKQLLGR